MRPVPLAIGGRTLGPGQPCLLIAHAGHAHHGKADVALRLVDAAFQAGADAVAFSVFRAAELVVRRHPDRHELEQLELPAREWTRILREARASGLAVVAEAYDLPSRDTALEAGVAALLSHATDVDHPELLRTLGAGGVPLLLAAGAADEPRVREALAAAGGEAALVLGPPSAPAPVDELRLGAIASSRERFGASVGVLDATDGGSAFALVAPALAAAHGAEFVLKRLVLDRGERGRDGVSAVSPEELHRCVELLRQAERASGPAAPPAAAAETERGRSIVAATLIARGDVLTAEQLSFKRVAERPGRGLRPFEALRIIGRRAARPIQADEPIREDMLE
jgi:N,N'-diacetyllegionaminate synthase